ncbi:MAG TPA: hypothetical protein VFL41_04590 [Gaiellaceae bacterium]|nr:hypothetical protein [Gaiellaceae bacterium]
MSVAAAPDPVSPELVLVSPPEVARIARVLLPEPPWPAFAPPSVEPAGPRPVDLALAYLISIGATVGPLVTFLLLR